MLKEFVEPVIGSTANRRDFLKQVTAGFMALTVTQISNITNAQEDSNDGDFEANEDQQSYASIEEWLERSPVSLRAKKALARINDLEHDEPSIREHAQKEIIESLQKVQEIILPVPTEFLQPLREKYGEASKTRNINLFYLCQRIIQTIEMNERDAPSTIPSHINYPPEEFPQVLSQYLGLTIEGLNDDLSAKIIRSELKKTPGGILSKIIEEDFFIEMDQNGGKIGIRRRVSSDPTQQAYDSGSIVVVTSLDTKNIYRATDFLRPKNRGPLLAIDSEGASATLNNIDLVVRRSTNTSPMFMEKKHSLAVPQPPNFHETVPTSFLPPSGAYITECPCFLKEDSASLPIIHASSPVQIPLLKKIIQTSLFSIEAVRIGNTVSVTMSPKLDPKSDIYCHSIITSVAGWSTFSADGKKVPASLSMKGENIVWTISNIPANQTVNLHTYLGLDVSTAKIPSHP